MKKRNYLLSLILACVMCLGVAGGATASEANDVWLSKFQEQNIAGWQEVEEQLDEIHAEIESYQGNSVVPYGVTYGGFTYLDGDIIITPKGRVNDEDDKSFTGHAAIIVGSKVLEIHPDYNNGKPQLVSMEDWYGRYSKMMVLRYTANRTIPTDAAWYGKTYYVDGEGKNHKWTFGLDVYSKKSDYCSSLVWKCYHYGAGFDFLSYREASDLDDIVGGYIIADPILPYDFINSREYNGFKAVHSINW